MKKVKVKGKKTRKENKREPTGIVVLVDSDQPAHVVVRVRNDVDVRVARLSGITVLRHMNARATIQMKFVKSITNAD